MAALRGALSAGRPWPLGADWDGGGVNFALFSAHAERVELCVLTADGQQAFALPACTDQVWHGYLPGAAPGWRYAYRVHGPARPAPGDRFDAARLLLDPCARELAGRFSWDLAAATDSAYGLSCRVSHEPFAWGDDAPPAVPWADTVLYEVHVKGATRLHPGVPAALRGTYAGLAQPAMLDHYRRLGITALNLLPVQHFLDEERLVRAGRVNYWGYNPLAFFAPEPRYAARVNGQSVVAEFRTMVRDLHAAGLEVIVDVVFNHTAETDASGPTLSLRGIDNRSYYRLPVNDPAGYENFSGCGNTLNLAHPRVLQLVVEALHYWVAELHVDGFRFDLATALTRDSAFLDTLASDPHLAGVKLIAEPWDLGPDGYCLGRFPPGWSEWNDRFRDAARAFWLTGSAGRDELARRLAGSSEIFRVAGRAPQAGINFIAAHDGFTLRDLVSYRAKHNEANGEANRDGHDHNHSSNCGQDGESTDSAVLACRRQRQRALLATLFIAQGVPMLQGGDELGRTQAGNNNAYCQDNALTWFDWAGADTALIDFVAGLTALRRRFPQLRQCAWLTGAPAADGERDVVWWHADGREMADDDWRAPAADTLGFRMAAPGAAAALLCLINRGPAPTDFVLPAGEWQQVCDSGADLPFAPLRRLGISRVPGGSVQLLCCC